MKLRTYLLGFTLLLAFSTLQAQPKHFDMAEDGSSVFGVGKIVLANWSYDDFWYAGKIEKVSHDKYFVRFFDNETEWMTTETMTFIYLGEGDKVFCKSEGSLVYKSAEIGKIEGEKVFVKYLDTGVTEWNSIGNIRIKEK
ncbi:MAG: tudor domain-containing protein [Saprospiraceae bacterium]